MEKILEFKAVPSNLGKGESALYRLVPAGVQTVKTAEFLPAFANELDIPVSRAQYFMDVFAKNLVETVMERKTVDLGWMTARLVIEGSLQNMTEQPTTKANPVRIRITFKGSIDEALKGIILKNVSKMVEATLHEIMQDGASGVNRIENENVIVINGKGMAQNASAADEGVTLEKDGVIVAKAQVSYSDDTTIKAQFELGSEITAGVYDLAIYTRAGKSAAEVSTPRKLVRKVTVA